VNPSNAVPTSPTISVITPVYDGSRFIREALGPGFSQRSTP